MTEWFKGWQIEIIVDGTQQASYGDMRTLTWFCKVDENNIMTDINNIYE